MSQGVRRGSVVLSGQRYSVVWLCPPHSDSLVLLPVCAPHRVRQRAGDVVLELADLMAAEIPLPVAVVRAGAPIEISAEGHVHVGELAGRALCRVVMAVARASVDAGVAARWETERQHRREAASVGCVNLVGP